MNDERSPSVETPASRADVVRGLVTRLWSGDTAAGHDHPGYWQTLHTFGILLGSFPDLRVAIQRQVVEGEVVVTQLELTGTHAAPFLGTPATGRQLAWTVVYVDTVRDGIVVEHASGDGWLDMLMAIGALPPPG